MKENTFGFLRKACALFFTVYSSRFVMHREA